MENAVLMSQKTKVGIGILVTRNGQILLGKRINAHGVGCWGAPGGHLEYGESPAECAARELEEETSLIATDIMPGPWTNDFFKSEEKHYITLFMLVRSFDGILTVTEPDRCLGWRWFDFNKLPQPLFLPLQNLLEIGSLESLTLNIGKLNERHDT
ncbi:MAG: RNA pyrophosphohydrolase [Chlamydiales bacterium]|nr:RNA pyrophosphohydrolase [Chlamydiales bacterium]